MTFIGAVCLTVLLVGSTIVLFVAAGWAMDKKEKSGAFLGYAVLGCMAFGSSVSLIWLFGNGYPCIERHLASDTFYRVIDQVTIDPKQTVVIVQACVRNGDGLEVPTGSVLAVEIATPFDKEVDIVTLVNGKLQWVRTPSIVRPPLAATPSSAAAAPKNP